MTKDKKVAAVVKVKIERVKRLSLTEINALADVISDNLQDAVKKHNETYKVSPEYKSGLKAIKTKHKVLKAERALILLQEKHPEVKFEVIGSDEYHKEVKDFDNGYYKYSHRYYIRSEIKNKLILEQINNTEPLANIIDRITQEFLNK